MSKPRTTNNCIKLTVLILGFFMLQPQVAAQNRIALVIGNSAYRVQALKNPINDAQDIADVLRRIGFAVELKMNINQMKESRGTVTIKTHPNLPPPTASKTITIEDFQVDLIQCNRKSTTVTCEFVVTNHGEDRNFSIATSGSKVFDEHDLQYEPVSVKILDQKLKKYLISEIPVKASITFNNIPASSTQFSVFELYRGREKIKFRNVAII